MCAISHDFHNLHKLNTWIKTLMITTLTIAWMSSDLGDDEWGEVVIRPSLLLGGDRLHEC